jgi:hypothetical protein
MKARPDRLWLPPSIVISLIVVILAGLLAALHPDDPMRRIGWALTLIALAFLVISLARIIWTVLHDMRAQLIVHLTECAIRNRDTASMQTRKPEE